MSINSRVPRVVLVLLLIVAGTVVTGAALQQGRPDEPNSLAAVGGELRLLRLSIESSLRSQTEMNALGVLLAASQSRITQLTGRLDALRDDIRVANEKTQQAANMLASDQNALSRETDAVRRSEIARYLSVNKAEADKLAAHEQELRSREAQLSNDLRIEEARWGEFVGRLEQITKR